MRPTFTALAGAFLRLVVLGAALVLASCGGTPRSGESRDTGGQIIAYERHVDRLNRTGEAFVIPRYCASACTMYLGARGACAHRDGIFAFHSASVPGNPRALVDAMNRRMASHYPPRLRAWFLEEGPGRTRSTRMVRISAAELIARGEIRACQT